VVDIDDRFSITTPEGVTVELVLAGAGSRGLAQMIDAIVQFILWIAAFAVIAGTTDADDVDPFSPTDSDEVFVAFAILAAVIFGITFLYDVLFETLGSGRTPGKRVMGLRVVRVGGGPVGFLSSSIRNLVRIVDALPGMYLIGLVAIVASSRNQRLGDLAAGTLVVRERTEARSPSTASWVPPTTAAPAIDVSTVTAEDLATIRKFLERRDSLGQAARANLASELAWRLAPKVAGTDPSLGPEAFLEQVAAAKAARG
jgi:uncharacterized RDD family membrane protein YckC